ncbi:alpha/beta fold hydrolase [bacterium]|nr:alpha/beta fold hydrolase [bacterium]
MIEFQSPVFKAAVWLPNEHLQTIYASLIMPVRLPIYRREIIELPDGDVIAADWVDGELEKPVLVLIHGMEGNSESRYSRLIMNECKRLGWTGVVLHMRSCGGLLNLRRTFYHAGYYHDIAYFLDDVLPQRALNRNTYLVGISLGGSQVAHYLSTTKAVESVRAAMIISTPLDLKASADFMASGMNRLYVFKFRNSLLKKYHAKSDLIQNETIANNLAQSQSFWDLDNAATAPMHGFKDASHYYREMSAIRCWQHIVVPTLYLASRDDPFIPVESMPPDDGRGGNPRSVLTDYGGHVGFVDNSGRSWMTPTIFKYLLSFEF